jgi:hypothetical protein
LKLFVQEVKFTISASSRVWGTLRELQAFPDTWVGSAVLKGLKHAIVHFLLIEFTFLGLTELNGKELYFLFKNSNLFGIFLLFDSHFFSEDFKII